MKLDGRILASVAVIGALACVPAAAQAGTVSVEETHPTDPSGVNRSFVHFAAAAGETNAVSIVAAEPAAIEEEGVTTVLIVRDTGAPLSAGAGCTALAADTASCSLHGWHRQDAEYCGHDCYNPIPGTAWQREERIELGDGNDSFVSSLGGTYERSWPTEVNGGSGNDSITTGSGADVITPGSGDDFVQPGEGSNKVIADPTPDGNDTLNLGEHSKNVLDYSARTQSLHLAKQVIGAAGEADRIGVTETAIVKVIGGSGDDEFHGDGDQLYGGPGDDNLIGTPDAEVISGGPGDDTIRGGAGDDALYGGNGSDLVKGGGGNDRIEEFEGRRPNGPGGRPRSGNDRIYGGKGNDFMLAGPGDDVVDGGGGRDKLYGDYGNDTLAGGAGNDLLDGEEGSDTMRGGAGDDELLAAYNFKRSDARGGVDVGTDSLDCGPGADAAQMNAWDPTVDCEMRHLVRAVEVSKVGQDAATGTATLFFTAQPPETVNIGVGGKGVKPGTYVSHQSGSARLEGKLHVRAQGAALRKLRRTGRVSLVVSLTWKLFKKPAVTERLRVGLVLRR
jgi:Ca2+-binding RTX toxin-like protein